VPVIVPSGAVIAAAVTPTLAFVQLVEVKSSELRQRFVRGVLNS
jgi:hypothetical protein